MLIAWNIRYLDRTTREFHSHQLYLNTSNLDPVLRAAVELFIDTKSRKTERQIFTFRHLFVEGKDVSGPAGPDNPNGWDRYYGFGLDDYIEDELGQELTQDEVAQILANSKHARMIPHGASKADIDLMFAEPKSLPVADIVLDEESIRLLGIFVRDLNELMNSSFMKDGPGKLTGQVDKDGIPSNVGLKLLTAVSHEEIGSFVTIFRRLYLNGRHDPACFEKTIYLYTNAIGDNPYCSWLLGKLQEYRTSLLSIPDDLPFLKRWSIQFNVQLLVDCHLYNQYQHQPNLQRQSQYFDCLKQVRYSHDVLTYLFLTEIRKITLKFITCGNVIAGWFERYCLHHSIKPVFPDSIRKFIPGFGKTEKEADRVARLLSEKAEELATEIWRNNGCPVGGHGPFVAEARERLLGTFAN